MLTPAIAPVAIITLLVSKQILYLIVSIPLKKAATIPESLTVATAILVLVQTPPMVESDNSIVAPRHIVGAFPVIP